MNRNTLFAIGICIIGLTACGQKVTKEVLEESNKSESMSINNNLEIATLGAGCFWCVEAVFQDLIGVTKVVSGYMGGEVENPSYKQISTGTTGHAEVARITFDPEKISFEELLEVFWTTHDPTTLNRQGADVGTQYRSEIFYHSDKQKEVALRSKTDVASELYANPIVTAISEASTFYEAEDYHQNFYSLNPNYGYCKAVIDPKIKKLRSKFSDKLKK